MKPGDSMGTESTITYRDCLNIFPQHPLMLLLHLGLIFLWRETTIFLHPPKGLDRVDAALKEVYGEMGAPEAWRLIRYNTGHFETAAMRYEILQFLRQWL